MGAQHAALKVKIKEIIKIKIRLPQKILVSVLLDSHLWLIHSHDILIFYGFRLSTWLRLWSDQYQIWPIVILIMGSNVSQI